MSETKKAKRLYPRRERALRAAGLALALLLFCNYVLHTGYLLPAQEIYDTAQYAGVYGKLKTVAAQWKPEAKKTGRYTLAASENALMMCYMYFSPLGWMTTTVWTADASGDGDVCAGVAPLRLGNERDGYERVNVFYGRIRGTDVSSLYPNVVVDVAEENHVYAYAREITAEERYVRDGYTYFLSVQPDDVPASLDGYAPRYQLQVNCMNWDASYDIEPFAP